MRFRTLFIGIACCLMAASAQTNFNSWAHYKVLTLNTSATGANVTANHNFFPVLVRFDSTTADVFTASKGRGADIRFTKANGTTKLPYQIERWDSAGKKAAIWVLLDTVQGNSTTQAIRMYWGKGGEADSSNGPAVFAASRGFVGVYHLNETAATAGATDASSNALNMIQYDAELSGFPTLPLATGLIAGARRFSGGIEGSEYEAFWSTSDKFATPTKAVTITTWFSTDRSQNNNRIFQRTRTDNVFRFMFTGTTGQFTFQVNAETALTGTVPGTVIDTWHLLQVVADSVARTVYIDGASVATAARSGDLFLGDPADGDGFFFGAKPTTSTASNYFQGEMDEFRFASVSRPATWHKLEWENQKAVQTLLTAGATQNQTTAPVIAYTTPVTYQAGFAVTNAPTYSGGPVTSFSIAPALSAGLSLNTTTGIISGTPTAAQAATNYTVTATGAGGTVTPTVNITVTAATAPAISYTTPVTDTVGKLSIPRSPTSTGGAITKYAISPALSAGLTMDTLTGRISGTPTATRTATAYTVTATGLGGTGTATINITVITTTGIVQNFTGEGASFSARASGRSIDFHFPGEPATARVSIADVWGRTVWSREARGSADLSWHGIATDGHRAASGVYVIRMSASDARGNVTGTAEKTVSYRP